MSRVYLVLIALIFGSCVESEKTYRAASSKGITKEASTKKVLISKDLTPGEIQKLTNSNSSGKDFKIIDVRTNGEFSKGHLKNAVLLNMYSPGFYKKLSALPRHKPYIIYCAVGGRSAVVKKLMKTLDFNEVYNMLGGIQRWDREGFPLVK